MLKSKLFLSLLMLAPQVHADVGNGSGYPYLAESNCTKSAKIPENSGGILFNRECSVGFVLPERVGKASLTGRPSYSLKLCKQIDSMIEEVTDYQKIIKMWKQRLLTTQDPKQAAEIQGLVKEFEQMRDDSKKSIDRIEGMRVNVQFVNRAEVPVHQAQELNKEIFGDQVRFQAAPISQGRLQYLIEPSTLTDGVDYKSVIRSEIPGNNTERSTFQGEVDFNGAIQGEMMLSLFGACPFVKEVQVGTKKYLTIDKNTLNQTITANYAYAVPVQSSVSYDATLDTQAALLKIQDQSGIADQFTRNQFIDSLVRITGKDVYNIHIRSLESPETVLTGEIESALKSGIQQRLTDKFLAILQQNGYVTASIPTFKEPEAKPGTATGIRRQCGSSGGIAGLFGGTRCWDVPYTYQINAANRADQFAKLSTSWNTPISESAEVNEIIHRINTSTFSLEPTESVLMEIK